MGNVPPSLSAVAAAIAAANTKKHDGVRIKAPHYLEQHDEHRSWTSNKTWHFETGWVYHVTAGQVLHQNLNLAEIHTTTNVLTMHVDLTPLNVHLGQKVRGMNVHYEPGGGTKFINYHGGHQHHVVNQFQQDAREVTITSSEAELSLEDSRLDFGAHGPESPGRMTLKADKEMTIQAGTSITLEARRDDANDNASLSLGHLGRVELASTQVSRVHSDTMTYVVGGNSSIRVLDDHLALNSGNASVQLKDGNLTTSATQTTLNGKVTIGQPAIAGMATTDQLQLVNKAAGFRDQSLRKAIADLKARLSAASIP